MSPAAMESLPEGRVPIRGVADGGRRCFPGQAGMGQAAATGRLTRGSSLSGVIVSSVM
jgi:hypothetical protein